MAGEVVLQLRNEGDSGGAELQGDAGRGKELLGIPGDRSCRPTAALYELDHAEPDARPHFEHTTAQWDLHIEVGRKNLRAVSHVERGRAVIVDPSETNVDQPAWCNAQYRSSTRPVRILQPITGDRTDLQLAQLRRQCCRGDAAERHEQRPFHTPSFVTRAIRRRNSPTGGSSRSSVA